jgi:SIR2-like protein
MAITLSDHDWDMLLHRIHAGKCTPFLGAGINHGVLPLGAEIARKWAEAYGYPLEDASDLARVAQFMAITRDKMFPKETILKLFATVAPPDFTAPDEPLAALADLPLPVYMTTNYDDFLVKALVDRKKDPRRELCRWNSSLKGKPPALRPTVANPVVFHLHGHHEVPESLVLTEDDYLDFLVNLSRDQDKLLPPRIQQALTEASLLFIGYRLVDWDFRVLFRGLVHSTEASLRRVSVAVQLPPHAPEPGHQHTVQKYLTDYFEDIKVRVYWGTAREFATELRERWRRFCQ